MDESSKKNPPRISPRAISLLVTIKQNLMDDNDLSLKVAECGKYVAAKYIDDLIANALALERVFIDFEDRYLYEKEENEEYAELLCGYGPGMMDDEVKEKIRAIVKEWEKEEVESDCDTET